MGPTVEIVGPFEANELSEFYNAIVVFVNPALRPRGLDLTLIEAMHCGKPVLTLNFPSITGTVVLNEGFGYTFAPNVKSLVEAMETAIADGVEVLERKVGVCKEDVSSMFTADKMASAYERFFLCIKNAKYFSLASSPPCTTSPPPPPPPDEKDVADLATKRQPWAPNEVLNPNGGFGLLTDSSD
ncbi:hypothetical protein RHSIM_Rhsim06G0205100 [Rhododendron simsii]|uniref:Glycosyl transferase family 1 domain-containing protein n=1 Tax=Rhododendron simsii TaxID=118357 RepID=A0A834LM54_RHOSS|nr:hypothetical protein RHSIM_Rhsim06G0205100 [Rhododendron simsii]